MIDSRKPSILPQYGRGPQLGLISQASPLNSFDCRTARLRTSDPVSQISAPLRDERRAAETANRASPQHSTVKQEPTSPSPHVDKAGMTRAGGDVGRREDTFQTSKTPGGVVSCSNQPHTPRFTLQTPSSAEWHFRKDSTRNVLEILDQMYNHGVRDLINLQNQRNVLKRQITSTEQQSRMVDQRVRKARQLRLKLQEPQSLMPSDLSDLYGLLGSSSLTSSLST